MQSNSHYWHLVELGPHCFFFPFALSPFFFSCQGLDVFFFWMISGSYHGVDSHLVGLWGGGETGNPAFGPCVFLHVPKQLSQSEAMRPHTIYEGQSPYATRTLLLSDVL